MQNKERQWSAIGFWLVPQLRGTRLSGSGKLWLPLPSGSNWPEGSYRARKAPKEIRIGTLQWRTLERIWLAGDEGLSYTQIQMFLLGGEKQLQAGPAGLPHERQRVWDRNGGGWTDRTHRMRQSRGHYGTWLSNQMPSFCTKGEDGRWRLTQPDIADYLQQQHPPV